MELKSSSRGKKNLKSLIITIIVISLVPLPFALVLTGFEGITNGQEAAIKEFLVSYFFGLFTFLVGLGWYIWQNRTSKQKD